MSTPVSLMLYDLESAMNIGKAYRIAEMFQLHLGLYDPRQITKSAKNAKIMSDFACGALDRLNYSIVQNFEAYRQYRSGRVIATCLREDAIPLHKFKFRPGDAILMGNEYDGLPDDIINSADAALYISLPDAHLPKPKSYSPINKERSAKADVNQNGKPNLNVSVAAGIICYQVYTQLGQSGTKSIENRKIHTPLPMSYNVSINGLSDEDLGLELSKT